MLRLKHRWNSLSNAAKSSIAFAISSILVKGISFITTPIFTRIISQDQYGIVSTYNSWMTIIDVFAVVGLTSAGVFNVGMKDHKENRDQFISSLLVLCNISTILVFGVIFLLKIPFGNDFILPSTLLISMFIHFMFNPAYIFWITRKRYEYKYKTPFLITVISTVVTQLLSIIIILNIATPNQGALRIWTNTLFALIINVPVYLMLLAKGKKFFDIALWKEVLIYALPLLPHYLAQHIMSSSDRIMISNLYSSTGTAIYSVASSISMISSIIWQSINASLVPYTFDKLENNREKEVNRVVIPILIVFAAMCITITLIAPEILTILAPKEYYEGIYAIPPIAATAFVSALYNIYANIEFYHKKTWWISLSTIVAAGVNLGLNFLVIPKFGYIGAAYTTLISQIVLSLMHYFGYKRCQKDPVFNNKIILLVTLFAIIFCLLCNFCYSNVFVRYGIIIGILVIMIFNRKMIISKIQEIKKKTM